MKEPDEAPGNGVPRTPTTRHVLVVDDDAGLNKLVQKTLRRNGFITQGVLTGAEAIARVTADPDLALLLDQQLPDMGGTELIRTLLEQDRRVPFVAMTGHGDEQIAVEMMKLGARDYLIKGINLTDLLPEVLHRVFHELETEKRLALAEQQLRESEERFKLAMEANRDGLWDCNVVTGEVYYSPNYAAMLGYMPGEITKNVNSWLDLIHQDDREAALRAYTDCLESRRENFEIAFRMQAKSGEWRWLLRRGKAASRDSRGRATRMIGTHTDITERKRSEAQIIEMKDRAEAASSTKSEFLANMSHEIRTPLNGVLGMLQLLETTAPTDEQKEYLLAAIQSTRRLTRLLADILDISRIEAGRMQTFDVEFGVGRLKESILELFEMVSKEKGLGLDFSIDARMPQRLVGDETRLRQILFNLVGNALKFTETGAVQVDVAPLPCADASKAQQVLFTVSDTGIGIPDDQLKAIFEPFVQGEVTYTRRFQGAGLGLSIVRKLVKMMAGELAIDNSPGAGTTFYLSLPFKLPGTLHGQAEQQLQTAPTGARLRVLFAEDDAVNLLSGKRMLEKSGHAVTAVRDGREVLQRLAEQDFDLILMDVQMPVLDGVAATRAIRTSTTLGAKTGIPIVAMTAYAMTGDREKFLAAGMDDYIAKPVDREALTEVIERALARSSFATTQKALRHEPA